MNVAEKRKIRAQLRTIFGRPLPDYIAYTVHSGGIDALIGNSRGTAEVYRIERNDNATTYKAPVKFTSPSQRALK